MNSPSNDPHQKVRPEHLRRDAYLYIRQSSLHQVMHNTESTQRQYALRQRAVALGWPMERVIVIDNDQGISGASAADREGFQRLVAEVGMGQAGIVLGLEVSRLARNSSDWHRLLEICALSGTLILDEDGLYDPSQFNDRLVLGLKGTMSEAELHVLRARLQGGIHSKAQRGELRMPLPVGLSYDSCDRVVFDPDQQVQQALRSFFAVFQRQGTALAVVRHFRQHGLKFPRRLRSGPEKGQLVWGPLTHTRALQVLHNPRYAGAFVFGRNRTCKGPNGRHGYKRQPQEDWHTLIPDAHPGYIDWQQYQDNQRTLRACAQAHGRDRRQSPPGQGPALLQGMVMCGVCGQRMTVRYHRRRDRLVGDYLCQREGIAHAHRICQQIPGSAIDQAVAELLLEMLEPVTMELAFAVQAELQARLDEVDRLRQQQVQRARYEMELARSRYMQVDPNHRLVADELEAEWNSKLRALGEAQQQYEQQRQADRAGLDQETKDQVLALAQDLPRLWHDPGANDQDRKRVVRLLIEDVTLIKVEQVRAQIRFKAGATRTLELPLPLNAWQQRITSEATVDCLRQILPTCTEKQAADELNRRGCRSGTGQPFTAQLVGKLRRRYRLTTRHETLRQAGMLTLAELAQQLGVHPKTVKIWHERGLLTGHVYNDKNECLYEPPVGDGPVRQQGVKLSERAHAAKVLPNPIHEVHREA